MHLCTSAPQCPLPFPLNIGSEKSLTSQHQRVSRSGTGERAQLAQCFPLQTREPEFSDQNPCKTPDVEACSSNLSKGKMGTGNPWGLVANQSSQMGKPRTERGREREKTW